VFLISFDLFTEENFVTHVGIRNDKEQARHKLFTLGGSDLVMEISTGLGKAKWENMSKKKI
jgi:hypothetical protein